MRICYNNLLSNRESRPRRVGSLMGVFSIEELEKTIRYTFKNKDLLVNALTHSSYANEAREKRCSNNERLEFLGDAVLGIIVADYLYFHNSQVPEGELNGRERPSILADAFEALVAAIYIDGGLEAARKFVTAFADKFFSSRISSHLKDYKTALQEIVQKNHG